MWELYEKSTEKLELNRVLELLADCAGSGDGKAACRAFAPPAIWRRSGSFWSKPRRPVPCLLCRVLPAFMM